MQLTVDWFRARSKRAIPAAGVTLVLIAVAVSSCGARTVNGRIAAVPIWPNGVAADAAIGHGVEIISPCCDQDTPEHNIEARAVAAKQAGFTGIRYSVHLSDKQDPNPPYNISTAYLDEVRHEIDVLTSHGFTVVLNNNDSLDDPAHTGDRLVALWTQVAQRFKNLPPNVYFEIANEPTWLPNDWTQAVGPEQWNPIATRALRAIRATNPDRIVVVGAATLSLPQAVPALELPRDDHHLIATFHNYLPLQFTHQGAAWAPGSSAWIGTTWLGTPAEVRAMEDTMNAAVCWSRSTGIPLFLGEFAAFGKAPDPVLWTKTLVQLAEGERISWTYFTLNGTWDPETRSMNSGLWDENFGTFNQPLLDALHAAEAKPIGQWARCPTPVGTTTPRG